MLELWILNTRENVCSQGQDNLTYANKNAKSTAFSPRPYKKNFEKKFFEKKFFFSRGLPLWTLVTYTIAVKYSKSKKMQKSALYWAVFEKRKNPHKCFFRLKSFLGWKNFQKRPKKNSKQFRKKFGKKFFLLLKSLENSPRPPSTPCTPGWSGYFHQSWKSVQIMSEVNFFKKWLKLHKKAPKSQKNHLWHY